MLRNRTSAMFVCLVLAGVGTSAAWGNSAPVVSSVTASQRGDYSKILDIYYNLADADGDACTVTIQASSDGGATWTVPITAISGAVGDGITPGSGKHITWNCGTDLPGAVGSQYRVRVCAADRQAPGGMVLIPAGSFQMGNTFPGDGYSSERPVHMVDLSSYYMDTCEVTNAQYAAALNWAYGQGGLITVTSGVVYKYNSGTTYPYCDTTTSSPSNSQITWNGSTFGVVAGKENHPMELVSWYGSVAYANWRSAMEGRPLCYDLSSWTCNFATTGYRLPTEAEWEKASRGGVAGHRFPWSDTDTIQHARANYYSYWHGGYRPYYSYDTNLTQGYHPTFSTGEWPYTSPVGYFAPNGYGLYDMAGNVWEWCNDWYSSYSSSPTSNPTGPGSGSYRVWRGGDWTSSAIDCRVGTRFGSTPLNRAVTGGFRLALGSEAASGHTESLNFAIHNPIVVPVVANVRAGQVQGSTQVNILYDLSSPDGRACQVVLAVSSNGGSTYSILPTAVSGAVGSSISPGTTKQVTWDAGTDWFNNQSTQMRVRITAVHPGSGSGSVISPAFSLDTRNLFRCSVAGTVAAAGGSPVSGAAVSLLPGNLTATSQVNGTFSIGNVPVGIGYQLTVNAAGYEPTIRNGLMLTSGPNSLGQLSLLPMSGTFVLRSLVPEINPGVSEVEEGGVAYRYYLVQRQSDGSPVGGVTVSVRGQAGGPVVPQDPTDFAPGWAGARVGVSDPGSGTVRLRIPAASVGLAGSTKEFETVVSGTVGPSFQVTVKPRSYKHFWGQESRGGVSGKVNLLGGVRVAGERGFGAKVSRQYSEGDATEEVERNTAARVEAGVEFGSPVGGRAHFAGGRVGAYGSAGAGLYAEFTKAFGYEFSPTSTDAASAALRLYCIYADLPGLVSGPVLEPLINYVQSLIEPSLVDSVWRWSEAGAEVGGYGTLSGTLGVTAGKQFAVGGSGELMAELGALMKGRYYPVDSRAELDIGFAGGASGDVAMGLGFRPYAGTGRPSAFQTIMDDLGLYAGASGSVGVEQFVTMAVTGTATFPEYVRLTTRAGGGSSAFGKISGLVGGGVEAGEDEVKTTIEVTQPIANETEWRRIASASGLLDQILRLYQGTGAPVINAAFGDQLARGLFPVQAFQHDMEYAYRVELVDRRSFSAGAEGVLVVGLGIKIKEDLEKGRGFLLQRGKMRGGLVYPLERTAGATGIPSNNQSIVDLQIQWASQASSILTIIWNRIQQTVQQAGQTVVQAATGIGTATLTAAQGAWQTGTNIVVDQWNNLAAQVDLQINRAAVPMADAGTINLLYGVGGMYRFTSDTDLLQPVTLAMTYQDANVVGIDESTLRIYNLDESSNRWELIGGQVDTTTNTITVSVSRLGVFAIAPALPTGEPLFQLSQSVVPADGTTTVTAEANTLLLNNGQAASDGWAYTVAATGMDIVTADQDPTREGVQVLCSGGKLTAVFRAPSSGGVGTFAVSSVYGDAHAQGTIPFADSTPPPAVAGVSVLAGQTRLGLSWDTSSMPTDVAGYRIYYSENHAGPPFDGVASVDGQPSPVTVSGTPASIKGLNLGSNYYLVVSAVDTAGNEGPLSSGVQATTIQSRPSPPFHVMSEKDSDGQFVISWTLSEDDGFNDRDVDHYDVYRSVDGAAFQRIATVPAGQSVFVDTAPPTGSAVTYNVVAIDAGGLNSLLADINSDGHVDMLDLLLLATSWGKTTAQLGYESRCDLNADGIVNVVDLLILADNWGI